MNDFASELQALIDKHREFPGANMFEIYSALQTAEGRIYSEMKATEGPFAPDTKFMER